MYHSPNISIIIPAINEEESIGLVLNDIPKDIAREIIVVDNGSHDNTANVAENLGAKVMLEPLRSYGSACLRGISALKKILILLFFLMAIIVTILRIFILF